MKDLYKQIADDIEKNIVNGNYKGSRKLPSVRDLCAKYNCSKSTVVKAFETLKNKHIVYSVPQSGYYIVEHLLKNEELDTSVVDFSTGNPLIGDIHIPDLKHCLDRAVDISNNYSIRRHICGTDSLRNLLPKYLASFQVFAAAPNIFINLGVQQALSIFTNMPFPNGKNVILIEQPTYRYFIDFLKHCGADFIGIKRDETGIDLNQLEAIFKKGQIKFFYTVPRDHNPLGTVYNTIQRKAIAELAAKYDVYVVEDDYFGDIMLDSRYDPIYAYGDHYHHIYIKSFSKIIPWFRIGIAVIPANLAPIFEQQTWPSYYHSYFSASLVSQATLDMYIRSNLLTKHITSMRKELLERLKCLQSHLKELQQYGIQYIGGQSGFYSYLKLPAHINENHFVDTLRKQHVLVMPGKLYYADNAFYEKGIRLSIARTNTNAIQKGFAILCSILKRY